MWDEDNNGNTPQGSFTYLGTVRDIIEFKVYPFRIPYPSDGSADNDFGSITLGIEEFNSQSFISRGNVRFQIIFQTQTNGKYIDLNPYFHNEGRFKFDKPITTLNKISLYFGTPTNIINFDPDRLICNFIYGVTTTITFSENHNLITGDTISFTNFTTLNPNIDISTIMNINNEHLITKIDNISFFINVNTTTITPDPNLNIFCIFNSKTFQIPIQVSFIRPDEASRYE